MIVDNDNPGLAICDLAQLRSERPAAGAGRSKRRNEMRLAAGSRAKAFDLPNLSDFRHIGCDRLSHARREGEHGGRAAIAGAEKANLGEGWIDSHKLDVAAMRRKHRPNAVERALHALEQAWF